MDIVVDGVVAVRNRSYLHDWPKRFWGIITRKIRPQTVATALFRRDDAFDHKFSICRNKKSISPGLRWRQPQRFAERAADYRVFVHIDGHPRQRAHTGRGVVTDPGDDRESLAGRFHALAITLPVMGSFAQTDSHLFRAEEPQCLVRAVVNILAVVIDCGDD